MIGKRGNFEDVPEASATTKNPSIRLCACNA